MLDSRPDLPAGGLVVPDFFQQDSPAAGVTFPHPNFLPAFKSSAATPFSSLRSHGRHLLGPRSYNDEILRTVHGHSFQPLVYNCHQFIHTDLKHKTLKPRDPFSSVPQFDSTVTNPLGEKHYLDHRLFAHLAFSQAPLPFRSAEDFIESSYRPRSYQSGQDIDLERTLTAGSESVSVVRSFRDTESFFPRKYLSSISSEFPKRTGQLLGRSEQREPWRYTQNVVAEAQVSHQRQGKSWTVDGEANAFQEMRENSIKSNSIKSNRGFLSPSFGELRVHNMKTVNSSQLRPSAFPVTSSATAANKRSSTSSTQPTKPQQHVSGLKEEQGTRTSSKETYPRNPRKGLKRWERLCRPKSYRDSATTNKGRPVMASRSSLASAVRKSQKMKLTHRAGEQNDQSEGGQQQEEVRKMFKCTQCRYLTDRKNNLKRHVVTMHHKTTRVLECCGTVFHNKASLRDHVALYHRGGYRCQVCGRNFCRKALLRRHLTVHSGQKDFACELCGYATSHKSNLERHQRVHTRKTALFGHDLLSHHHQGEPDSDPATLTPQGTMEPESDNVRNTETSFGGAFLNHLQEDSSLSSEGTVNVETLEISPFPRYQHQHPTSDDTELHQQNAVIENIKEEHTLHCTLNTTVVSERRDLNCEIPSKSTDSLSHSSNPKFLELSQLTRDSQRLCTDSTNLQSNVVPSFSDAICISCCAYPEADQSAVPPSGEISDNDDEALVNKTRALSFRNPSKSRPLSRKCYFPNRLNETYPSNDNMILENECMSASGILMADSLSYDEEHCDGETITENLRENDSPSMNTKPFSLQPVPSRCSTHGMCTNQKHDSDDNGHLNKRNEFQSKVRMYSLPYRCSGCSAGFTHQGELCGHVCQVQGGCLLNFPLMSSVLKGCIKLSALELHM